MTEQSRPVGSSLYVAEIQEQVEQLAAMEAGWHDGDGEAMDPATLAKAAEMALLAAPAIPSYRPWLVPCFDGSIQVEWHAEGWDVELTVSRVR